LVTPVSSANKTGRHDISEILLKGALNTITLTHNTEIKIDFSQIGQILHANHIRFFEQIK
jgi:hypothetical protein